ncbi:glycoside hydrolase family 2 TIM barrel-domain containing protein [Bifidobacterium avesanii]|uniref:Glycoside hydrolase family 2 catalytic domain-containing protein n=1 Tax=Bifidobacterium avesanii TaxID=1798157 RepID=A0A7K3TK36_9BIFI|nr:glycoside hydrolase family 2 TIM barrel-domain containing protein [Bifidobacterium avesanii]KAB8290336.1 hypothetical protein DSM100685_1468 [Bifidobacterium avesanii]NEG78990.1 hypothetical protein [Bifidobacterium avesanii]
MLIDLQGQWEAAIDDGVPRPFAVPGTLDESGIGYPDVVREAKVKTADDDGSALVQGAGGTDTDGNAAAAWATRFTRRFTYEGPAVFSRSVDADGRIEPGDRVFLEIERARCLSLRVNGEAVAHTAVGGRDPGAGGTLSTPHVFEVTGLLGRTPGRADRIELIGDNSYPGLPYAGIIRSSAATDETQTNWNGLLGYVRLRTEPAAFVAAVRAYPKGDRLRVEVDVDAAEACAAARIRLTSPALKRQAEREVELEEGRRTVVFDRLPLRDDAARWDEGEGNLHELTVTLETAVRKTTTPNTAAPEPQSTPEPQSPPRPQSSKTIRFGIRDFGADAHGRLAINGRAFLLRGEANCAVFPETGHAPMDVPSWRRILETYRSYGVNVMRFHSWCPPDAAFEAADGMGMMMQPELSHWDYKEAFEGAESYAYYAAELEAVILALANHPSFVMLTLGNELACNETGHARMDALLARARALDTTRLYANGSNVHYGHIGCDAASDFYTAAKYHDGWLRATGSPMAGPLNGRYANAANDYAGTMAVLRASSVQPVFGFEVGQYEVLPDFGEIDAFHGVTDPANYRIIRDRVRAAGLDGERWRRRVEATGELALLCYREEVEAVMRTPSMSGLSLLGLQDFPGQGTALVGMLNAHLEPKPYDFARPERFRAFFRDRLPLALLPRYTYESGDVLAATVKVANYGRTPVGGPVRIELRGGGVRIADALPPVHCPAGALTDVGELRLPLAGVAADMPLRLDLTVSVGDAANTYPIWVYPRETADAGTGAAGAGSPYVHETRRFDAEARAVLAAGGTVYLSPPSTAEALPHSIQCQFSTDFWSVGTFPAQSGAMGQLIDAAHPLFRRFPTETHTNWQWWPMARRRAVVLPGDPEAFGSIVTELDSYAFLRPMTQLMECRCGGGRLLFSAFGLQDLAEYPEARALQAAIRAHLADRSFAPRAEVSPDAVAALVA